MKTTCLAGAPVETPNAILKLFFLVGIKYLIFHTVTCTQLIERVSSDNLRNDHQIKQILLTCRTENVWSGNEILYVETMVVKVSLTVKFIV